VVVHMEARIVHSSSSELAGVTPLYIHCLVVVMLYSVSQKEVN